MYRILVVEDERPINDLIEMNLTEAGYSCVCAYDGLEAANLLEKESFDLVLLDIMLPKVRLRAAGFHKAAGHSRDFSHSEGHHGRQGEGPAPGRGRLSCQAV